MSRFDRSNVEFVLSQAGDDSATSATNVGCDADGDNAESVTKNMVKQQTEKNLMS